MLTDIDNVVYGIVCNIILPRSFLNLFAVDGDQNILELLKKSQETFAGVLSSDERIIFEVAFTFKAYPRVYLSKLFAEICLAMHV